MCNACGFFCCGYDGFDKCGCVHCPEPACHADVCWACGEVECLCGEDYDYGPYEPDEITNEGPGAANNRSGDIQR